MTFIETVCTIVGAVALGLICVIIIALVFVAILLTGYNLLKRLGRGIRTQ